jgi:hypothetical protein
MGWHWFLSFYTHRSLRDVELLHTVLWADEDYISDIATRGSRIAVTSWDNFVGVWRAEPCERLAVLKSPSSIVCRVAIGAQHIVVGYNGVMMRIRDARTLRVRHHIRHKAYKERGRCRFSLWGASYFCLFENDCSALKPVRRHECGVPQPPRFQSVASLPLTTGGSRQLTVTMTPNALPQSSSLRLLWVMYFVNTLLQWAVQVPGE